MFVSHI
jgi:hypothetical protein